MPSNPIKQSSRKVARSVPPSTKHPACLTVEVSCFDLARVLDWVENATLLTQSGERVSILDTEWYRDAYRAIELAFWSTMAARKRWPK